MPNSSGGKSNGTRVIALVGPAGAGKTSLAEAMLFAARFRRIGGWMRVSIATTSSTRSPSARS